MSTSRLHSAPAAALSTHTPIAFNDLHDADDPETHPPRPLTRTSLRRTHVGAAAAGISSPLRARFAEEARGDCKIHDFDYDLDSSSRLATSSAHHSSGEERRQPRRALRISKNTQSAILYALEEGLRHPYPFSSDLIEENASMSDLIGARTPPAGRSEHNGGPRITDPSIRGPRAIMQERTARETRRKAEQEASDRQRAADDARMMEEDRRRNAERRGAPNNSVPRAGTGAGEQRNPNVSQEGQRKQSGGDREPLQGRGSSGRTVGADEPPSARTRPAQPQPKSAQPASSRTAQPGPSTAAGPSADPTSPQASQPRSSFPHAFERWETLSAHWEGLTSFWIRRLEENGNEIDREPISQQLSRQVTDLSAAGANLFHAVVELQRLRASSERKFQRWFFETREEQERLMEVQAVTKKELHAERASRSQAINEAIEAERARGHSDKMIGELKRELEISKQEARRAWEELGRREQEERERTIMLRDGQPIMISGVQVVPMMQSAPARHGSVRDIPPTRDGPAAGFEGLGGSGQGGRSAEDDYQQHSRSQRSDPSDPFVEETPPSRRTRAAEQTPTSASSEATPYSPAQAPAPAVQPASSGASSNAKVASASASSSRREEERTLSPPRDQGEAAGSDGEEYEVDAEGEFVRDGAGDRIRYTEPASDEESDGYDATTEQEREQQFLAQYGHVGDAPASGVEYGRGPTSSAAAPSAPAGQDVGAGPGWEAFPRHHHPTRLSDVLEEDERSRTSASLISGYPSRREA